MSKARARRRTEREVAQAAQRAARARLVARRARRRAVLSAVRRPFHQLRGARTGRRRPDSALRRQRGRQDGALAAALFALNGMFWLFEQSWMMRGGAVVLSVLAWPLLVVLVFDRGRSA